jgi:membrane fusion protein (multidrug efflux system)
MPEPDYQTIARELQDLKDEQRRLRDEQQRLRDENTYSKKHDAGGDKKDQQSNEGENKDGQNQDKQGQADADDKKEEKKEGNDKDQGEGKNKDGKDKKEQEHKPPLKERARAFIQTHPKQVVFGAIGFAVLCVAMVFLILYLRSYESTDDAQVDGHLNAVSTRVMGTVQQVYVEDGQVVTAGQLLVELDPRDLQNTLLQAKASYASAEAQLRAENPNVPIVQTSNESTITTNVDAVQSAQSAIVASEQEYQSRLAMLRQAEANDANAQLELARYRELVRKEEVSHQQFDNYVAAAKTQTASVEAARASAEAARKSIDQSRAQLSQTQARLEESRRNAPRNVLVRQAGVEARVAAVLSAKAQADQAELNLTYTKIYAPANGIVSNKSVEVGQRIEPGEQLLIVSQTEDIWITANFKETQLRKMHPGQDVVIHADTYDRKYHGYVQSMPGATGARTSLLPPENATGNFVKVVQRLPVRIRLKDGENNDHLLRPGMSVEPKVWLK